MSRISYDALLRFTNKVLEAAGLDQYSRDAVAKGLCETSLRGVDSHGIRLLPHYAASARSGRKNPEPDFSYTQKFPSMGVLDADNGFGHAAGMKAIEYAIEVAEIQGMATVAVTHSSHPGAMASFALKAARQGYIGFAYTHADSLVRAHGGKRAYFGTNPVCMAAPRREIDPFCLDMATSTVAWNRLLRHRASDTPMPDGMAADQDGVETTDPHKAAALLPAGGYKGYGLGAMVEILCGIMTGMAFARDLPAMFVPPMDKPRGLGQFYMVMRCDSVIPEDQFRDRLQQMTDQVRSEPVGNDADEVMLPGDPEIHEARIRYKDGIPLDAETETGLRKLSDEYGVALEIS